MDHYYQSTTIPDQFLWEHEKMARITWFLHKIGGWEKGTVYMPVDAGQEEAVDALFAMNWQRDPKPSYRERVFRNYKRKVLEDLKDSRRPHLPGILKFQAYIEKKAPSRKVSSEKTTIRT